MGPVIVALLVLAAVAVTAAVLMNELLTSVTDLIGGLG